jgi:2-haloacid dehalogenase
MDTRPPVGKPSPRFDAVVFDAYGTLFDVHSVAQRAGELFPGQGDALSQLWRRKQLEYSWLRAMGGRYKPFADVTADALAFAADSLGLALDAAAATGLMGLYSRLPAFPENADALGRLKAAGLPLGILSNGNPAMIDASVRSAGLQDLFDHLLSADQVRSFKTMASVYSLAPQAFGCPAERILFVSSNSWDAVGARWFGFTSFWINRAGAPAERLDTEPHYTGRLLTDVVAIALAA